MPVFHHVVFSDSAGIPVVTWCAREDAHPHAQTFEYAAVQEKLYALADCHKCRMILDLSMLDVPFSIEVLGLILTTANRAGAVFVKSLPFYELPARSGLLWCFSSLSEATAALTKEEQPDQISVVIPPMSVEVFAIMSEAGKSVAESA